MKQHCKNTFFLINTTFVCVTVVMFIKTLHSRTALSNPCFDYFARISIDSMHLQKVSAHA